MIDINKLFELYSVFYPLIISFFCLIILFLYRLFNILRKIKFKKAGFFIKAITFIFDFNIIFIILALIGIKYGYFVLKHELLLVILIYYFVFYLLFDGTIGDKIAGISILNYYCDEENIAKASAFKKFIRSLLFLITPISPLLFFISPKKKRLLNDMFSHTEKYVQLKIGFNYKILYIIIVVLFFILYFLKIYKYGQINLQAFGTPVPGAEALYFDLNKDGKEDGILIDANGLGRYNLLSYDSNFDGKIETIYVDANGDGFVDEGAVDVNLDGKPDFRDTNGNGLPDAFKDENGDGEPDEKINDKLVSTIIIWGLCIFILILIYFEDSFVFGAKKIDKKREDFNPEEDGIQLDQSKILEKTEAIMKKNKKWQENKDKKDDESPKDNNVSEEEDISFNLGNIRKKG